MPDQRQITVQPSVIETAKPFGTRNDNSLKSAFPDSPIFKGDITRESVKEEFQKLVLDGVVTDGLGLSSFNRDFTGTAQNPVPNLADVETGAGGLPATPFVPNLTSPGEGNGVNAAAKPEYNKELLTNQSNVEFGSGLSGLTSPSETSPRIAEQGILGTYISGRSYQGSDGKA